MFKGLYPYRLMSDIVDPPRMGLPTEYLIRRRRRQEGRQEEDRREEHHRPDCREHLDRLTYFDTLYLDFLNLLVVKALDQLIYISALNLIVVRAPVLLIYLNALYLIGMKALNMIDTSHFTCSKLLTQNTLHSL